MKNHITKRNNRLFETASPAEQRRMIARDVIAQLQLGKYTAASFYMGIGYKNNCMVCGVGSCMVSMQRHLHPSKSIKKIVYDHDTYGEWKLLERYFSTQQLALIEEFFENGYYENFNSLSKFISIGGKWRDEMPLAAYKKLHKAKKAFVNDDDDATKLLTQIMENIIRNGEFDPLEEVEFQKTLKKKKIPVHATQSDVAITADMLRAFEELKAPEHNKEIQTNNI